jgi:hypothetical protein
MKVKGTVAAVGSVPTLVESITAAAANAGATGTVKAQIQRTTALNLPSQDSVYNVGDKLTLVDSTRRDSVKGYFGLDKPYGGWHNLPLAKESPCRWRRCYMKSSIS